MLKRCFTVILIFQGVRRHSIKIGLNTKIKIDLVIVGSVAVTHSGKVSLVKVLIAYVIKTVYSYILL